MPDLSQCLESCFDREDSRAPVRAFVFGAVITSIAITISSLAVDPRDLKMLGELLVGAVFFGGGCSAMFALPPESFRRLWSLGFQVFEFLPLLLPLKVLIGIALFPGVFIAFAFLVTTVSALSALRVLYVVIGTSIRRLVGACTHIDVRCTEELSWKCERAHAPLVAGRCPWCGRNIVHGKPDGAP